MEKPSPLTDYKNLARRVGELEAKAGVLRVQPFDVSQHPSTLMAPSDLRAMIKTTELRLTEGTNLRDVVSCIALLRAQLDQFKG